mgnify:CR=1 FL=1
MKQHVDRQQIFISGGAGFIGANLVKYLLDRDDCDITVYDNLSEGSKENLDKAIEDSQKRGKVKFIQGDILDFDKLANSISGHNAVVHLAAFTNVVESIKNPKEGLTVNSVGTFNVLDAARIHNVDKFVFASSNAAVGEQIPPINETMVPKPLSPYGAVKLYGEALCSAYYHSYGLKTVSLRFANVYGPYSSHKTSVVAKFLKRARQGQPLEIYGDGNQTRDFIHAEDISQAIHLILMGDNISTMDWGEVFQIATGQETRIIDLAETINNLSGSAEQSISFGMEINGEIRRNFSDIRKSREVLGFQPKKHFRQTVEHLVDRLANDL